MLTLNVRNRLHIGRWLLLVMLGLLHGVMLLGVNAPWTHPLLPTPASGSHLDFVI